MERFSIVAVVFLTASSSQAGGDITDDLVVVEAAPLAEKIPPMKPTWCEHPLPWADRVNNDHTFHPCVRNHPALPVRTRVTITSLRSMQPGRLGVPEVVGERLEGERLERLVLPRARHHREATPLDR